jgi:hypothetical protein
MNKKKALQKSRTYFEQVPLHDVLTTIGEGHRTPNDTITGSDRRRDSPTDGDTKPCPQCRDSLVFNRRYPCLRVGAMLVSSARDRDRIRYEPAWVCRNGGCDYRELIGDR